MTASVFFGSLRRNLLGAVLLSPVLYAGLAACSSSDEPNGDTPNDADASARDATSDEDAGDEDKDAEQPFVAPEPSEGLARDVLSTHLQLNVTTMEGTATIEVVGSTNTGLSFEIGDLDVTSVKLGTHTLKFAIDDTSVDGGALKKRRLDIGVPSGNVDQTVTIAYKFSAKEAFDGWMPNANLSFLWPYFCSNLYPCHSNPADGTKFELEVEGVPQGQTAVYPASIPFDAPTYMPAIAIGDYSYTKLGMTSKGTEVGYWSLPAEASGGVAEATAKLTDIFDWYETNIGEYKFGKKVATVDAHWGPGAYGGMEHHPFFHVASDAFGDENVHAHEAAHGWFGNGVRLKCWEDFVLSEGTVTYLAARATEVVRGKTAGDKVWADYRKALDSGISKGDTQAWPQTCGVIDILTDPLWSTIPYYKGAFFYKRVADAITPAKLDAVLAKFYATYAGKAASMSDMIALIKVEAGYDPTALVDKYLKGLGNPEAGTP